ncbi:hypothetical protein [Hymenobacter pini]|uniref:hypothetical protein n=1 Tax=Hymenobacter pini TaxID=2880879 RepID=UPI001CF4501F|nr:hypothetical protein [Hymenobacter pini]MCA8831347.1 hypothetical protein [Hymenobacter pini]
MLQGSILIRASLDEYDYDWCDFEVVVTKGQSETQVRFGGAVDTWREFGLALQSFPSKTNDYRLFESGLGSLHEEKLILKAYCYDSLGHTALTVNIDRQEEPPADFRIHFSIPAEVASLNQLGRMLANWEVKDNAEIYWEAQTS